MVYVAHAASRKTQQLQYQLKREIHKKEKGFNRISLTRTGTGICGWTDGWMNRRKVGQTSRRMNESADEQMNDKLG